MGKEDPKDAPAKRMVGKQPQPGGGILKAPGKLKTAGDDRAVTFALAKQVYETTQTGTRPVASAAAKDSKKTRARTGEDEKEVKGPATKMAKVAKEQAAKDAKEGAKQPAKVAKEKGAKEQAAKDVKEDANQPKQNGSKEQVAKGAKQPAKVAKEKGSNEQAATAKEGAEQPAKVPKEKGKAAKDCKEGAKQPAKVPKEKGSKEQAAKDSKEGAKQPAKVAWEKGSKEQAAKDCKEGAKQPNAKEGAKVAKEKGANAKEGAKQPAQVASEKGPNNQKDAKKPAEKETKIPKQAAKVKANEELNSFEKGKEFRARMEVAMREQQKREAGDPSVHGPMPPAKARKLEQLEKVHAQVAKLAAGSNDKAAAKKALPAPQPAIVTPPTKRSSTASSFSSDKTDAPAHSYAMRKRAKAEAHLKERSKDLEQAMREAEADAHMDAAGVTEFLEEIEKEEGGHVGDLAAAMIRHSCKKRDELKEAAGNDIEEEGSEGEGSDDEEDEDGKLGEESQSEPGDEAGGDEEQIAEDNAASSEACDGEGDEGEPEKDEEAMGEQVDEEAAEEKEGGSEEPASEEEAAEEEEEEAAAEEEAAEEEEAPEEEDTDEEAADEEEAASEEEVDEEQADEEAEDEEQAAEEDGAKQPAGAPQLVPVKKELVQAVGATQPPQTQVRNSATHKQQWDKFDRQIKNSDLFPSSLAPYLKKKKADLFGMWLDSNECWDKTVLAVERYSESKNLARKQWVAVQGKELKKRYDAEQFEELIAKRESAGLFYKDEDFPDNKDETWYYMPSGRLVREDNITGESMTLGSSKSCSEAMQQALTGDGGPLPAGLLPSIKTETAEGQRRLFEKLDEGKDVAMAKRAAKKKKKTEEEESKELEPKALLESGTKHF